MVKGRIIAVGSPREGVLALGVERVRLEIRNGHAPCTARGSGSPVVSHAAMEKAASIQPATTRPPAALQPQPARMGKRSPTVVARDSSSMLRVMATSYSTALYRQ
jgi:hypothetical protein